MPGPPPKPAAQRRRTNKTSTAALLKAPDTPQVPALPGKGWSPQTQAWWQDLWSSPMAPEFTRSDVHGLVVLAELVEMFWSADPEKQMTKVELAKEIRLQRAEYGLTPLARRRLQWETERGEEAATKTAERRASAPVKKRAAVDPRLKA